MNNPNITYTINPITKFDYENLNFLVLLKLDDINKIKKTMIFVNSVKKNIASKEHL